MFYLLEPRRQANIFGGPSGGTEFSLEGACSRCGTGAEQVGALRIKPLRGGVKIPKDGIVLSLDMEFLVSESLAMYLSQAGFDCLGPVLTRAGTVLPIKQLLPQETLPPFSNRTTGVLREDPCPACGRNGYFGTAKAPLRLSYDAVPPSLLSLDVLATWERFGTSVLREPFTDSVLATPQLVVSNRFMAALTARQVRKVEFQPVNIADA